MYQFNVLKWRLQKFNLRGICEQGKTFQALTLDSSTGSNKGLPGSLKKEIKNLRQFKVLAINEKLPQFLITPPDTDFMKTFYLVQIHESFTISVIHEWNTKTIECEGPPGKPLINLYKHIIANQKLGNSFKFAVNQDFDLAIGFVNKFD